MFIRTWYIFCSIYKAIPKRVCVFMPQSGNVSLARGHKITLIADFNTMHGHKFFYRANNLNGNKVISCFKLIYM
jgi:hypothetical protein